jgi:holo-[acyl-carrier protein] synthase
MLTTNTTEADSTSSIEPLSPAQPWISVGTDLVLVADVRDSLDFFGDRYLRRVYTPAEIDTCRGHDGLLSASCLAARFAAKEATVKAMRTDAGVSFLDIEVGNDSTGAPTLTLSGSLRRQADQLGAVPASISLAHHGEYAIAVCLFVRSTPTNSVNDQNEDPR